MHRRVRATAAHAKPYNHLDPHWRNLACAPVITLTTDARLRSPPEPCDSASMELVLWIRYGLDSSSPSAPSQWSRQLTARGRYSGYGRRGLSLYYMDLGRFVRCFWSPGQLTASALRSLRHVVEDVMHCNAACQRLTSSAPNGRGSSSLSLSIFHQSALLHHIAGNTTASRRKRLCDLPLATLASTRRLRRQTACFRTRTPRVRCT
jgi:hypothetical protein